MSFERYAIYWAPRPDSELAAFARGWFASDAETGETLATRQTYGLEPELVDRATASPRRYGIHATLKAPFRLSGAVTQDELVAELGAFAARRKPPRAGCLKLRRFSEFLALVPEAPTAELEWLAAQCVTHFDRYRAPLNDADRARRTPAMSGNTAAYFEQFGYPYIFEHFKFHITLAGPLDEAALDAVETALAPAVAPLTREPFAVSDLCLFGDPGRGGLFRILHRQRFI